MSPSSGGQTDRNSHLPGVKARRQGVQITAIRHRAAVTLIPGWGLPTLFKATRI